jgi:hypothetical protein
MRGHFAHYPGAPCSYGEGESERHLAMKAAVEMMFPDTRFEVPLSDSRRADCVVDVSTQSFVVECQESRISVDEWWERTHDYNAMGYPVLWLWGLSRFNMQRGQSRSNVRRGRADECGVGSDVLNCHWESLRVVHVVDDANRMLTATLGDAHERPRTFIEALDDYTEEYTPTTIKRWLSQFATPAARELVTPAGLHVIELGDTPQLLRDAASPRYGFTWHVEPPTADEEDDW